MVSLPFCEQAVVSRLLHVAAESVILEQMSMYSSCNLSWLLLTLYASREAKRFPGGVRFDTSTAKARIGC